MPSPSVLYPTRSSRRYIRLGRCVQVGPGGARRPSRRQVEARPGTDPSVLRSDSGPRLLAHKRFAPFVNH